MELTNILKNGFYFSIGYDLSSSLQRTFKILNSSQGKSTIDIRFIWNYNMALPLLQASVQPPWLLFAIQVD